MKRYKVICTIEIGDGNLLKLSAAADADIKIGDEVLMFRKNPVEKWTGPFLEQRRKSVDSG